MTSFDYSSAYPARRAPVAARNIVATSQPLAAQAGLDALRRGGNAVDAAIAAAAALTVVEPTGCGLGSDGFAILWDGKALHGLNASGRAPAAWTPERFEGRDAMPWRGWDSVTVPGAVSAWAALSRRFGTLPFADLLAPAIAYARDGFLLSPTIAKRWGLDLGALSAHPGFAETFAPGGAPPRAGEVFRNPDIARTLEEIAATGGESFYRGDLARRIAAAARDQGGAMTEADLAAHQPDWCGTVSQSWRDVRLHEIPPNGQGIAALIGLGICEHLPLDGLDPDGPEALHLQIEAMKLAMADADRYVADLDAMDVLPEALLDPDYLRARAALVDPARAKAAAAGAPKAGGTVYLTAADASGMMISFIQSNYAGFGSGVVVPGTGIHMQNRGAGFTLEPGHPNRVGPGKRPFHTIIPGFLTDADGAPVMSLGVMGGPMQAQGHVQMVRRTRLWNQTPQAASDAPRWRFVEGLEVAVETDLPEATLAGLEAMGHRLSREAPDAAFGFGGAQLIHRLEDGYLAGSDSRKDGGAVGF